MNVGDFLAEDLVYTICLDSATQAAVETSDVVEWTEELRRAYSDIPTSSTLCS
jgi:hypothetical protein